MNALSRTRKKQIKRQMQEKKMLEWGKMSCIALNNLYGFGRDRLADFLSELTSLAGLAETDEEFWTHIDRRIHQLGLEFLEEDAGC